MRIVCDNCSATYRIPEHKLVREVNKATCRKCGHAIIIRRSENPVSSITPANEPAPDRERTQITSQAELQARALARQEEEATEAVPPTVINPDAGRGAARPSAGRPATGNLRSNQRTASPTPAARPAAAAKGHDPSGDLSIVMMACFAAAFGALVLATSQSSAQTFIGLFITLWSATTSLFVLVTGNRGRKEASVVMSLVIGLLVAGGFSGGLHAMQGSTEPAPAGEPQAAAAPAAEAAAPAAEDKEDAKVEDKEDAEAAAEEEEADDKEDAEAADDKEEDDGDAVASAEPKKEDKPETSTQNTARTNNTSTQNTARTNTTQTTRPATETKQEEPAAPTSTGVPLTVLDTMIKSNRSVKTCFALYRQETGSLPSGRITVTLTVEPTGQVTGAGIQSGAYAGTSLDTCLGSAITKITFPAFTGSAKTYRYPFIL
jgi:predicted Zn finger-like uncharacterized protein